MTLGGLIAILIVVLFLSWMVSVPYLHDGDHIINPVAMVKGFFTFLAVTGAGAAIGGLILVANQVRLW
jgi:hypothetical protein